MYEGDILDYFPTNEHITGPREGQKAVILAMDKAFKSGKRIIILESPVGSGKSAIGKTFANAFGEAHMITPRKSLQNQYYEDFKDDTVLMKGRGSYPCTYGKPKHKYNQVIQLIRTGSIKQPGFGEPNCSDAPCRNDETVWQLCNENNGPCPYSVAIETAQEHECIIHNIHSFIFQTNFAGKFAKREVMIIDEAHEIESTIRGFITKKFTLEHALREDDRPSVTNDIDAWCDFFLQDRFVPKETEMEVRAKERDPEYMTHKDTYLEKVQNFRNQKDYFKDRFVAKSTVNHKHGRVLSITFEFIPENLGNAVTNLLLSYGEHVILMSGTIYDKNVYCRNIGINPEDVYFIRVPSTFPLDMRPMYAKPEYQVDTSYQNWRENFPEMIEKMAKIMNIFDDAKGLIHAPSYEAAQEIVQALPGNRAITHSSQDFQEKLEMFYASPDAKVFVSPVCQQGVDFKYDRARFQIITRVPYANTSDEFVGYKMKNDFSWYNYQALVVFGQQIGRVNRSEDDYGATFLLDSRFNRFITRNMKVLPKWLTNAIHWK